MKPIEQFEVLVVDDQKSMRELAMLQLYKVGFRRIHEAINGSSAKDLVVARQYDLVMLDWNLGDTNGLEVLKFIRATPLNKATCVLIATGENKLSNVQSAMTAGASNYITKPYNDLDLRARLERALMRRLGEAA